jgi:hypothetical protein
MEMTYLSADELAELSGCARQLPVVVLLPSQAQLGWAFESNMRSFP